MAGLWGLPAIEALFLFRDQLVTVKAAERHGHPSFTQLDAVVDTLKTFKFQIWASQGGGQHKPPTDLLFRQKASWGVGKETRTLLKDTDGQVCVCVCVCKVADDSEEEEIFQFSFYPVKMEFKII